MAGDSAAMASASSRRMTSWTAGPLSGTFNRQAAAVEHVGGGD
jgi:hypothetical protein